MYFRLISFRRSQNPAGLKQDLKKRKIDHNQSQNSVNQTGHNAGESQMHNVAIVLAYRLFQSLLKDGQVSFQIKSTCLLLKKISKTIEQKWQPNVCLSENVLLSTVNTGTYIFKEIYIYKIIANKITVEYRSQYIRSYTAIHQLKTNLHTVVSCFQRVTSGYPFSQLYMSSRVIRYSIQFSN